MRVAKLGWLVLSAAAAAGLIAPVANPRAFAAGGDPAAKAEVIAAFQRLNALPSYRIKWTGPDGTGIMEFVQPDKRHMLLKSDKGSFETYSIGLDTRTHYDFPGAPSGWRCVKSQQQSRGLFDTDKMQKDWNDEVVRKPDLMIDGAPARGYADTKHNGVLYIGAQNGLPRRFVSEQSKGTYTGDFYDFGAPIAFNPPPCG